MIHINNKEDCCGCTACESICGTKAITLKSDEEGFLYPTVDIDKCIDCHLCEKVCPIIFRKNQDVTINSQQYYALRHKDEKVLKKSSSGGAFSVLSSLVLSKGGVVIGATYDEKMEVRHIMVKSIENLPRICGSKYVQSDILGLFQTLKKMLDKGILVLFSGTPCQVEGLNLFLRKKYKNLITIDIVCHAVGSPKLFKEYIGYLETKLKNKVTWMNMRDKDNYGWGHRFSQRAWTKNGKSISEKDGFFPWWNIFYSHMTNRPSCHECKFTNFSRPGDITIADFWDDRNLRPELHSIKGTSVCIVNSEKGGQLLNDAHKSADIWEITKEQAWQPCLETPTLANEKREEFWKMYEKEGLVKAYEKFIYIPLRIRMMWWIKDSIASIIGYK